MYKLLILTLTLPFISMSQGFQVNFQGQQQQGLGGAGAALPQDASILFFNPGAASFVQDNEISVAVTPIFSNGTFLEKNTNETAKTTSPIGTPFSAYGLFKHKEDSKISLGMAIYTPFGSTSEWEEGWTGRFALTRLKLLSIFFQPTVSYKISKKIGIGAGFIYTYGKVNLQKDLPLQNANGDFGHAELGGTAHGFGYNLGIYFEPTKFLNLALTYRSQVDMNLKKGKAEFTVPESLSDKFPSGDFTSSIPLPSVITLGIAVKPTEKLSLVIDVNYVNWKAYDTLAFDYENNTSSLTDTKSARNYKGTFAFRLGAQYKFTPKLTARLGLSYAISPVQSGYVTPETPDNDRLNYSCGLGYSISDKFAIDASFLFTKVEREDTNIETGLSGKFKTIVFAPGIAVSYKF